MMFPFVVPLRHTGAEPAAIMRFVLKSETRFQPLGQEMGFQSKSLPK